MTVNNTDLAAAPPLGEVEDRQAVLGTEFARLAPLANWTPKLEVLVRNRKDERNKRNWLQQNIRI
jgi:hypothetical protein